MRDDTIKRNIPLLCPNGIPCPKIIRDHINKKVFQCSDLKTDLGFFLMKKLNMENNCWLQSSISLIVACNLQGWINTRKKQSLCLHLAVPFVDKYNQAFSYTCIHKHMHTYEKFLLLSGKHEENILKTWKC